MKIGIALSLYDKVDQLKTNIEIIRKHWSSNNDAFISVCCNGPSNIVEKVKDLDVNSIVVGDKIGTEEKAQRRARIVNCIQKSILSTTSDFIIHYHSDAYATNIESIISIINKMEEENYHVAYRGKGLDYRSTKTFAGDVDDHYLVLRRDKIIERGLFDFSNEESLSFLYHGNPETFLANAIAKTFNSSEIFHYDNMSKNKVHESCVDPENFYGDGIRHRHMNPFNFDVARGFYHIGNSDIIFKTLTEAGVPSEYIISNSKSSNQT